MDPFEARVAGGLIGLVAYVLVAWRSPRQGPPVLSHDGLRWRVWHGAALRPGAVVPMLAVMTLLATGWGLVSAVLLTLAGPAHLDRQLELVLAAPVIGALVAILAVPWMVRASWTRIEATPAELRLARPWPRRTVTLRWADVTKVREGRQTLVLGTPAGEVVLEAPGADPEHLRQVVGWMQATRAAPAEAVAVPPPPHALRRLLARHGSAVQRSNGPTCSANARGVTAPTHQPAPTSARANRSS